MIDLFKAYKNFRKYKTHKNLRNNSKYDFHTFEFIKINKVYKKVNSLKYLIEKMKKHGWNYLKVPNLNLKKLITL